MLLLLCPYNCTASTVTQAKRWYRSASGPAASRTPFPAMQEEIQGLEDRVESVKAAIADALPRRSAAQARYEATSARLNKATEGYIALVQKHRSAGEDGASQPAASTGAAARQDSLSHALMQSHSATTNSVFSPEAAAMTCIDRMRYVPCGSVRPILSYPHTAPLSLAACTSRLADWGDSRPPPDPPAALADMIDSFKDHTAVSRGVPTKDICWFLQSCYCVDGAEAAPCGVDTLTPAQPSSADCLSFSSAFASDECRLSFFVFFLAMSLEVALLTAEEDHMDDAAAVGVATGASMAPSPSFPIILPHDCFDHEHAFSLTLICMHACTHAPFPPPSPPPTSTTPSNAYASNSTAASRPASAHQQLSGRLQICTAMFACPRRQTLLRRSACGSGSGHFLTPRPASGRQTRWPQRVTPLPPQPPPLPQRQPPSPVRCLTTRF